MEIKLSTETINQILQVLSQLPNSTGTYGLMLSIKEAAEAQIKEQEETKDVNA